MDRLMKQMKNVSSERSKRSRTTKSHQLQILTLNKDNFKAEVQRLTSRVDQPHPPPPSPALLPSLPSPQAPHLSQASLPSPQAPHLSQPSPLPPLESSQSPRLLPGLEERESLDASVGVHFDDSMNQNFWNDDLFELSPKLSPIKTSLFQQEENIPPLAVADAPFGSLGCPNAPDDLHFPSMLSYQQEENNPLLAVADASFGSLGYPNAPDDLHFPPMLSYQQEENISLPVLANEPSLPNFFPSASRIQDWLNSLENPHPQPLQPDQQEDNNIPPPVPTALPSMNLDGTYVLPSPSEMADWPSQEDIQSSLQYLNSWDDLHPPAMQLSPNPLHSPSMSLDWTNFQDALYSPTMVLSSSFRSSPSSVLDWPDSPEYLNSPTMLPLPDVPPSSPTTGLAPRN